MGTVPAVLAGNHPLASPPGAELAEAPQEEICGVGALLDLQGLTGCSVQTWGPDPSWC